MLCRTLYAKFGGLIVGAVFAAIIMAALNFNTMYEVAEIPQFSNNEVECSSHYLELRSY
jgi:hypothetical protein